MLPNLSSKALRESNLAAMLAAVSLIENCPIIAEVAGFIAAMSLAKASMTLRLTLLVPPKFIFFVSAAPEELSSCLGVIVINPVESEGQVMFKELTLLTMAAKLAKLFSMLVAVSSKFNFTLGLTFTAERAWATLTVEEAIPCL